jgi:hypothetical protein
MAVEWNSAKFLLLCRKAGISFERTLTLGRQHLQLSPKDRESLFPGFPHESYADGIFKFLGGNEVVSLDVSAFEGASLIHDLNTPVPDSLHEQFDFVLDGGTMEHVFNFPTALKSSMQMVKVGGHLMIHSPTNNYCGHGFYQLSPELFFRALSNANGFRIKTMLVFEAYPGATWYEVMDPASIGRRIELASGSQRILLLVLAQRTHIVDLFKDAPQQSDYVTQWEGRPTVRQQTRWRRVGNAIADGRILHEIAQRAFRFVGWQSLAYGNRARRLSIHNQPGVFRQVDPQRTILAMRAHKCGVNDGPR